MIKGCSLIAVSFVCFIFLIHSNNYTEKEFTILFAALYAFGTLTVIRASDEDMRRDKRRLKMFVKGLFLWAMWPVAYARRGPDFLYRLHLRLFANSFKDPDGEPWQTWPWLCKRTPVLMIDGTGNAAMCSFRSYVEKWNPDVQLCGHSHSPVGPKYCAQRGIPVVWLYRARVKVLDAFVKRHRIPYCFAHFRYDQGMKTARRIAYVQKGKAILYHYNLLIDQGPARLVREINKMFGLDLAEGDNILPHINKTADNLGGL